MRKACSSCGKPVSTEKTVLCRACYHLSLESHTADRNEDIVYQITHEGKTASQVAKTIGITREAVRLIIKKNLIDYSAICQKRLDTKRKTTGGILKTSRTRKCAWCGTEFEINKNGAKVIYHSDKCREERQKVLQRERIKNYYKTPKGKAAQKTYADKNKEKIKEYFKNWKDRKQASRDHDEQ